MSARHNWFLCLGTQLIVMKNQLPSAAHCGIVCGSFLRTGKSTCGANELNTKAGAQIWQGGKIDNGAHGVTRPTRLAYFGASEATILSKRGSPRSGSQIGSRRRWP